jgi:hypothetical protein
MGEVGVALSGRAGRESQLRQPTDTRASAGACGIGGRLSRSLTGGSQQRGAVRAIMGQVGSADGSGPLRKRILYFFPKRISIQCKSR